MSKWLEGIKAEAAKVTESEIAAIEPGTPVKTGENAAGTLDDDMKKLLVVWSNYKQAAIGIANQISALAVMEGYPRDEVEELKKELSRLKVNEDAVYAIFWATVSSDFGLWNKQACIRKGWQVVWSDSVVRHVMSVIGILTGSDDEISSHGGRRHLNS